MSAYRRPAALSATALSLALLMPVMALAQDDPVPSFSPELIVTPAQPEGPFYPLEIPADHDSDLTVVAGAPEAALGTPLLVEGLLLTASGVPVAGATVEIWQTDRQGIYLHPGDPDFAQRDPGFQGYGESVTDRSGAWSFSTILPDVYGGRPRHIHAKVRIDDGEVLTTQIYFADPGISLEGSVAPTGTDLDALIVELLPVLSEDGADGFRARHLLVLP
jgi:protocatechuate 3,4-dioxygenase beta subunit